MTSIERMLRDASDKEYAAFSSKLAPTLSPDCFIGVRVPKLRLIAKEIEKLPETEEFLKTLPHRYYDENLLHSILLIKIKPYEKCLTYVKDFLPYIDNWAVCDTLRPKVFEKNKERLLPEVISWIKSDEVYTIRFGLDCLMTYYLDEDYKAEYLNLPLKLKNDDYYVKMMVAWYYATALAKQWNDTIVYIENKTLDPWIHNKTIQKAIESFRITDEQKTYLRTLKV